jgi:hypothetical protein
LGMVWMVISLGSVVRAVHKLQLDPRTAEWHPTTSLNEYQWIIAIKQPEWWMFFESMSEISAEYVNDYLTGELYSQKQDSSWSSSPVKPMASNSTYWLKWSHPVVRGTTQAE